MTSMSIGGPVRWLARVAVVANALLTAFVAGSAVMRYAFGSPFHFTEELVGLLFLAGVALALPAASLRDEQIKVTLLVDATRGGVRRALQWVGRCITLVFTGWLLWLAFDAARDAHERGSVTEQAGIPAWIAFAIIGLSAFGMFAAEATRPWKSEPGACEPAEVGGGTQ